MLINWLLLEAYDNGHTKIFEDIYLQKKPAIFYQVSVAT